MASGTLRTETSESPFRAEHERLLRTALRRGDTDPEATLRGATLTRSYHPTTLAIARRSWLERMRREHHSAAVFSNLLPQLMEAEAPLDFKMVALRMSMDELRHAALAAGVVTLLGGEPALETDLRVAPMPIHEKCTPIERALRNVLFVGALNETIGVAVLTEERHLVKEPVIGAVLTQLIGDEVNHAKLGWLYFAEVWPRFSNEQRERTSAYLPYAFAHLERTLLTPMAQLRFEPELREELSALGLSSPQDLRELFQATVEAAVLPPLDDAGLRATEGWHERARV